MASEQFIPGDVIMLSSDSEGDEESSATKKRTYDDTQESEGDISATSSRRSSKRAKMNSRASARSDEVASEEGEIDETENKDSAADSETKDTSGASGAVPEPPTGKPKGKKGKGKVPSEQQPSHGTALMPPKPNKFRKDGIPYKLPSFSSSRNGSWYVRFQDWARVFYANNLEHASTIGPVLIREAYESFVNQHSGLKKKQKPPARQASKMIEDSGVLASLVTEMRSSGPVEQPQLADSEKKPSPKDSNLSNGKNSQRLAAVGARAAESESTQSELPQTNGASTTSDQTSNMEHHSTQVQAHEATEETPPSPEEMQQQRRYFPSARDPSNMCLLCGREGHTGAICANRTCRFCRADGHWDFACPRLLRCDKCRQMGHSSTDCEEKLALTKDEGLACAFCESPDHLEKDCTEFWRSFHPEPGSVHTVTFIPCSCATCGSSKHFSADCNQRRQPANPTWSANNRDRYLDPDCQSLSIEETAGRRESAKISRAPELRIRGHAARTNNVVHYSDDDSEVEFLGKKPSNQRPPLGQIRMASNIQMPNNGGGNSSRRGQSQPSGQPPLPPGPPPPGPPPQSYDSYPPPPGARGYNGYQPSAPPPSLPTKPPSRDYRNVPPPPQMHGSRDQTWQANNSNTSQGRNQSRGRGGGRGGRGGRGRGRGRGRGN